MYIFLIIIQRPGMTRNKMHMPIGMLSVLWAALVLAILLYLVCFVWHDYRLSSWIAQTQRHVAAYPTTLVTAYYPLANGSKHSSAEYMIWLSNFIAHTRTPIIAYLPPGNMSIVIQEMRRSLPLTIKVRSFRDSNFDEWGGGSYCAASLLMSSDHFHAHIQAVHGFLGRPPSSEASRIV